MDVSEITDLLGLVASDPTVEAELRRFAIEGHPQVTIDPEDADGPVVEVQDWMVNNALGIEFGFEEDSSWLGIERPEGSHHAMLLTQLYLYGDHPDVQCYAGQLPFKLALTDSRAAVRRKMAALEATRRSYLRDSWELPAFRMIISYSNDESHIGFILCMLRPMSLPALDDEELQLAPTLDDVLECMGRSWNDPFLRRTFVPLGLEWHSRDTASGRLADFRTTHGFELGFTAQGGALVLTSVVFYRDREFEARQWRGALPFNLVFDQCPSELAEKVGRPADARIDEQFAGSANWRLHNRELRIAYSTMENVITQVRVSATPS